jgi:SAM-dependent methyltransferase
MINYDKIADGYAQHRRASALVVNELAEQCGLTSGSRILEIGCGTGNHVRALVDATGCEGWGLEPSAGMIQHASSNSKLRLVRGSSQFLPFGESRFDLVFSINVLHYIEDTELYFREAIRLLRHGGMICTVTDSYEMIERRRPLSQYWPETIPIEMERYHDVTILLGQMSGVGFGDAHARELSRPYEITDITPFRERVFSCLRLISDDHFQDRLKRMEDDLKRGPIEALTEYVCIWGTRA